MWVRRLAPLLAAGAVILVALIAANAGQVQVGEPILPFDLRDPDAVPTPLLTLEPTEELPDDVSTNPFTVGIVFYAVVVGVVGVVFAGILITWLVRWLLSRQREQKEPDVPSSAITVAAALRDATELAVFEAEAARPGEATDAVVACWVILEEAAASAGTPRGAPQTPTEFTASVLAEHRADPAAVHTLLGLYHEARFGQTPLPDEAAGAAAAALRNISASLLPVAVWRKDRS